MLHPRLRLATWSCTALLLAATTPSTTGQNATAGNARTAGQPEPTQRGSSTTKDAFAQLFAPVLCPVTGEPVVWTHAERFRGQWVYFATAEARATFAADPFAYAEQVQQQWAANPPLRIQVRCPQTGRPVDPAVYAGIGRDAVCFADEAAKAQWLENSVPAGAPGYQQRSGRAGVPALDAKLFTFQTMCAHSNRPIDPQVSLDVDGRTLYFFCPLCRDAFASESQDQRAAHLRRVDYQMLDNECRWLVRELRAAERPSAPAHGADAGRRAGAPPPAPGEQPPANDQALADLTQRLISIECGVSDPANSTAAQRDQLHRLRNELQELCKERRVAVRVARNWPAHRTGADLESEPDFER